MSQVVARLLTLDNLALAGVACCWPAAGVAAFRAARDHAPRTARVAAALVGAAVLVTAARVALGVALAGHGWWFAADRLLVAVPLVALPGLVAAAITLPALVRTSLPGRPAPAEVGAPGRPAVGPVMAWPVLVAGYGGLGGVSLSLIGTYPISPLPVGVVVGLVAVAAVLTGPVLTGRVPGSRRLAVAGGTFLLCFGVVWAGVSMWSSRLPDRLNLGTHHATPAAAQGRQVPVTALREPASGGPVRRFTLTARPATVTLTSGRAVPAWTFDGRVPGPTLRVRQGELIEVRLRNRMPGLAVTLHWHGYHVPAGDDGVAGVTQDAVRPGGEHVYRFRAAQQGSYWYHSHDMSDPAVRMGLFGMLVVDPPTGRPPGADHTVALHTLGGVPTLAVDDRPPADGQAGLQVAPGTPVRLRIAATDNVPATLGLSGVTYRLAAVDGGELSDPGPLSGQRLRLAAGGRYDLTFTMPPGPVLLSVDGRAAPGLLLSPGPASAAPPPATPPPATGPLLDITAYGGKPQPQPADFDREITWVLDRRLTLLDGVPRLAHTVNGQVWPDIVTPVVREGELIKITVVNRGKDTHPMHPHGHHVLVLSRDGRPATGPLWMDTFDVAPGEVWVVALRADNPGLWMSHCHDLGHAALGMTFHLAYEGVTTPFDAGAASGNHPE
ncbi:multicopper oxidase family protein [Nonomuraea sp. NN258]|uniref:multicopper oxidase family protein n=1 Tax=Nonomuraea antri TaxID=2730852 RepID=UPI001568851A|nr:multicopper oxidase family protein [Nonomuraea antri]NRQ30841.1 multicopper oxidase family protein [Nonomuraea antri]